MQKRCLQSYTTRFILPASLKNDEKQIFITGKELDGVKI